MKITTVIGTLLASLAAAEQQGEPHPPADIQPDKPLEHSGSPPAHPPHPAQKPPAPPGKPKPPVDLSTCKINCIKAKSQNRKPVTKADYEALMEQVRGKKAKCCNKSKSKLFSATQRFSHGTAKVYVRGDMMSCRNKPTVPCPEVAKVLERIKQHCGKKDGPIITGSCEEPTKDWGIYLGDWL